MKKLIVLLSAVAMGTATSVYAAEVNFKVANPALQNILDTVISGDDTVDFAYPKFDESVSSFTKEILKYDVQGSLKNTPWLDGGKADIVGTSTYKADRTEGHLGIAVTAESTVRTDVMSLLRYSGYMGLKRKGKNTNPDLDARIEAHLKRLAVAQSLDEIFPLLLSSKELGKQGIQELIDSETNYLNCLETGPCHASMGARIEQEIIRQKKYVAEENAMMASAASIQIEATKENGKITALTLTHLDLAKMFVHANMITIPVQGKMIITLDSVKSSVETFSPLDAKGMNQLISEFNGTISGLENGDLQAKKVTQNKYREALIIFKNGLHGDFSGNNSQVTSPTIPTAPIGNGSN